MNRSIRKFVLNNLLLGCFFALIGLVIFSTFLSTYYNHFFILIVPFAVLINILEFYSAVKQAVIPNRALLSMATSFIIKFFSYLGLTIIFFLYKKDIQDRLVFILIMFSLYIAFTIIEVTSLSKYLKTKDNNSN